MIINFICFLIILEPERTRVFFFLSLVLFGFEGDEIQIRLTSLPWNLMSGADSGNYLLCKLGCSLEPSTASLLRLLNYLSSFSPWLSLPLPPKPPFLFPSMLKMLNNPLSLHIPDWSSASCQTEGLVSLLWSLFTILIIIKRRPIIVAWLWLDKLDNFVLRGISHSTAHVSWSFIQQSTTLG